MFPNSIYKKIVMPKMGGNNVIKIYTYQAKKVNEKDKPLIYLLGARFLLIQRLTH